MFQISDNQQRYCDISTIIVNEVISLIRLFDPLVRIKFSFGLHDMILLYYFY